jgi:hypothetical protein
VWKSKVKVYVTGEDFLTVLSIAKVKKTKEHERERERETDPFTNSPLL